MRSSTLKTHPRTGGHRVSGEAGRGLGSLSLLLIVAVAACAGTGAPATPTAAPLPTTTPVATAGPTASAAPLIIEDAGLETLMVPGTYTSRLFKPALQIELGEGWFRRDAGNDRTLNLRRGLDGSADLTFISIVDFLQCGTGAVVTKPDARTIVDAIAGSAALSASDPAQVPVGDLTGLEVRLAGSGDPVPEADFAKSTKYGCVMTRGEEPFPAEGAWLMATRDLVMQLVAVDIAGTTVLIRARSVSETDAHFDLVLEVLAHTSLG